MLIKGSQLISSTQTHQQTRSRKKTLMANQSSRQLLSVEAFDDAKAGVMGLLEEGIKEVPPIFVRAEPFAIPVIDLEGIGDDARRKVIIKEVQIAALKWGFFQIVNHGVPIKLLDEMQERNRSFHEQPREEKRKYYTRDGRQNVVYNTFYDSYRNALYWRDNVTFMAAPGFPAPNEMPKQFRDILKDYSDQVKNVGKTVLELLSEALELQKDRLIDQKCLDVLYIGGHYYPPCPQPELTYSTPIHSDNNCLTLVQQGELGGALQVLYENEWVDVPPMKGALVVNFGDVLQGITGDLLKEKAAKHSVLATKHRVRANKGDARMSIRSFFTAPHDDPTRILTV